MRESAPRGDKGKAKKLDVGKMPAFQGLTNRFPRALLSVAGVSLHGMEKYGSYEGWETVPNGAARYADALGRHVIKRGYEVNDPDSGLRHAAHAAWNALAVLELELRAAETKTKR